jgi:hypothetical protein
MSRAMSSFRTGRQDQTQYAASGARVTGASTFDWTYPLLAIAVLVHVYLCWRWRTNLAFDAKFAYLPLARRLLSEGWAFLAAEESVWVPFGAYGYPALLDADVQAIEAVNVVLSGLIVLMLYRIAVRAHSVRAGLIAAWLYAVSPSVAPLVINVLTELPFLFFCAVWLWAFSELGASGQRRWVWIAGLALGCAVNMRTSLVPFIYGSAILAAVAGTQRIAARDMWRKLAGVQGIAAALVTVVLVKNWLLFDLPQLATGGGNALYLGSHSLTGGYEPLYGGLFFDVDAIVRGDHLTVAADRLLHSVGWEILKAAPLELTLANYWRKVWAFLFYPNVLLSDSMFTLRSLRICLVAGAAVAMIRGWRTPALLLAASVAAYQVVVHTPLLYNPRYSEGALDLWLPLLAGCGFATVSQWSPRNISLFVLAVAAACYAGKTIRHLEDRVAPLHFNASVPHRIIWEQLGAPDGSLTGLVVDSAAKALVTTGERPSVRLTLPDRDGITGNAKYSRRNLFLILELWTPSTGKRCDKGRIDFEPDAVSDKPGAEIYYPFRLQRNSAVQTFSFGIASPTPTWQAGINGPGTFKIAFSCDPGGVIRLDRLAIAESTYATVYGRRKSSRPSATSVSVVEYYNTSLDHYFITWVGDEIAALDAGTDVKGWTRTGQSFNAYTTAQFDTSPVCRFLIPPGLGNSHFFGSGSAECDATRQRNLKFVLESSSFMHMFLPQGGNCPIDTTPVYRVFNNRPDANHRYMTDKAIRDQMVAKGWLAEGEGPDQVVLCAPQ